MNLKETIRKILKEKGNRDCGELYFIQNEQELFEPSEKISRVKRLLEMTEFEGDDIEKKKEIAKKLVEKYLTMKVRYTDKFGEDYIDFKKDGSTQLRYYIKNISTFNGKIDKPFLVIGYQFLKKLVHFFSFENVLSQDEIIQTIINWFNERYNKNITINGWEWVND